MIRDRILRCAASALLALAAASAAPAAPARGAFASDRMTVEVRGEGNDDVILIPGLASSRDVWKEAADVLAARHRVHLVQVAGFAGEPARASADGNVVAPLVEELDRYIREARLGQPAVVGHSLGGATALALAERHPDAVGRLVIVDALPFFPMLFGPVTAEQVRPQADAMRDATLAMPPAQFAAAQERTMQRLVKSDAMRPVALRWSLDSDRSTLARAAHELMVTDLRADLPKVHVPAMVIYAADEAAGLPGARADALYGAAYQDLAGVKLVRIDDASHFLMWDQPARFAKELDAFLALVK